MKNLLLVLGLVLVASSTVALYQLSRNGHYVPAAKGTILDTRTGAVYDPANPLGANKPVSPPLP
jgi:hypothetical protein